MDNVIEKTKNLIEVFEESDLIKKERSKEKDSCVEYLVFIYVIIIYI